MPVFLLGGRGSDGGELLAKGDYLEGYMLSEGINERIFQASEEVSRRAAREMAPGAAAASPAATRREMERWISAAKKPC